MPFEAIIWLALLLAIGFLLIILSCALFGNWLPMLVALTFVCAPLPNAIFARCAGVDDFSADYTSGPVDFGHFLTAVTVATGFALPIVLNQAKIIHPAACWMSLAGGTIVYSTILLFSYCFAPDTEF